MSLLNNNFIAFNGEPVTGRVPTQLIVKPERESGEMVALTPELRGAVSHAYKLFCDAVMVSAFPNGYHVQNRQFPDGSSARFESNLGVHKAMVWPVGGGNEAFAVRPVAWFASTNEVYGVGLAGDKNTDWVKAQPFDSTTKVGSIWTNPPLLPAGGSYIPEFKHSQLKIYDPNDLNGSIPGNMDWYDQRPKESNPHYGLVLTWWYPGIGRYASGTMQVDWEDEDLYFAQNFGAGVAGSWHRYYAEWADGVDKRIAPDIGMFRHVWLNGVCVASLDSGLGVAGACLYRDDYGGTWLRILATETSINDRSGDVALSGQVKMFQCRLSAAVPDVAATKPKKGEQLELAWESAKSDYVPMPMLCNSSGTNSFLSWVARTNPPPPSAIYSISLGDGSITPFTGVPVPYGDQPAPYTTFEESITKTDKRNVSEYRSTERESGTHYGVLAIDFVVDEPVFVYAIESNVGERSLATTDDLPDIQYEVIYPPYESHTDQLIVCGVSERLIRTYASYQYTRTVDSTASASNQYNLTISHSQTGVVFSESDSTSFTATSKLTQNFKKVVTNSFTCGPVTCVSTLDCSAGIERTARGSTGTHIVPRVNNICLMGDLRVGRYRVVFTRYEGEFELVTDSDYVALSGSETDVDGAPTGSNYTWTSHRSQNPNVTYVSGRFIDHTIDVIDGAATVSHSIGSNDYWGPEPIEQSGSGPREEVPEFMWSYVGETTNYINSASIAKNFSNPMGQTNLIIDNGTTRTYTSTFTPAPVNVEYWNDLSLGRPIHATSSFDKKLYFEAFMDWPSGANWAADRDSGGGLPSPSMSNFTGKITNLQTGEEVNMNNSAFMPLGLTGDTKLCTLLTFLGPVKDSRLGTDRKPKFKEAI